ncbi:MAG: PEGA domain-containing protein, partial [Anaeromyxobacteraceae bacterium]
LRAALRDRAPAGVLEVAEMRARLLGPAPSATLADAERACARAEAALDGADHDGAARALREAAAAAEAQPASAEAHALRVRALARLAYAEKLRRDAAAAATALDRLVAAAPGFAADPAQYPPSYLRDLDAARQRASALPTVQLTVSSNGAPLAVFVDGRPAGTTPLSLALPAGRHRLAASAGSCRVPPSVVELAREPRTVVLDAATAGALRLEGSPGLAAKLPDRSDRALAAGAWMGAARVVTAALEADGGAPALAATLHDLSRGAAVRSARVRLDGGDLPAPRAAALAAFLLDGLASPEVAPVGPKLDLAPRPPPLGLVAAPGTASDAMRRPRTWVRPAAYASGGIAIGFVGLAVYEAFAARSDTRAADALLATGIFPSAPDAARHASLVASASRRETVAYASAASAGAFAIAAAVLGYLSRDASGAPVVRF